MRVLVTWGSKRGGTEGIARSVARTLEEQGFEVSALGPREALRAHGFDAVVVGGALYATRWHRDARRFVRAREKELRTVPVWFFSSGPLDDSADATEIPPTKQVAILMERVGAQGHATFGGRLEKNARGFPASAMAKKSAGDFRNETRIRDFAEGIADALPSARPRRVAPQPGRSLAALLVHAEIGWVLCAAIMMALLVLAPVGVALAVHAVLAPIVFALIARHYFRYRGARDPLPTAAWFTGVVALLDVGIIEGLAGKTALLRSLAGFWLPLALIFLTTWAVGALASLSPMPRPRASS